MHARAAETRDINIGGGEGGKGFTYLRVGAGHEGAATTAGAARVEEPTGSRAAQYRSMGRASK